MENLISVIVPVYNTGDLLYECVNSILNQTYKNIEIILVDDGSSQETALICDKIASNDEKVKVLHKKNGGSSSARNAGLKMAKGEYVAFVDSDDYIEKDMYSVLLNNACGNNVKIVFSELFIENYKNAENYTVEHQRGVYSQKEILHEFLLGSWHSVCTNLYHVSVFDELSFPENEINEDYILNYYIIKKYDNFFVETKRFYHYVKRAGSNTEIEVQEKHLTWIKHTEYIRNDIINNIASYNLREEAEYQYLFSNIVLANKCLLCWNQAKKTTVNKIFEITVNNLKRDRKNIKKRYLSKKHYLMGMMLSRTPRIYKTVVLFILKVRKKNA